MLLPIVLAGGQMIAVGGSTEGALQVDRSDIKASLTSIHPRRTRPAGLADRSSY